MAYLIDADVLIEAKDRYYGFAFCPGFWDWLSQKKNSNQVLSVKAVGDEIGAGQDQLSIWCAGHGATMFVPVDPPTTLAMATVSATVAAMQVNGQPYTAAAITEFFAAADYYLIAYALAHGHTVVTNEKGHAQGQQPSVKRLKIPNVCVAVGVTHATVFEMLANGGASLVLAPGATAAAAASVAAAPQAGPQAAPPPT